jgi:hypothetical protein
MHAGTATPAATAAVTAAQTATPATATTMHSHGRRGCAECHNSRQCEERFAEHLSSSFCEIALRASQV